MRRALLVAVSLAAAACGGGADGGARPQELTLRQRVLTVGSTAKPIEETQYLTPTGRITDNPQTRSILDLRAETLTTIDKSKQTYSVVTFEELRRANAAQQRDLADAPSEVKQLLDPPVALAPTGRRQTILGYDAQEYTFASGEFTGSAWVAEALRAPMEGPQWEKFAGATAGAQGPAGKLSGELAKLNGLPLRVTWTITIGDDRATYTTEVLEVRKQGPPPDLLATPRDFQKVESPLLRN